MGANTRETPADLEIRSVPRRPVEDPTLGVPVDVDHAGTPTHRLVTIGDSLTHGFMSGAIRRTDMSWPAIVAHELGLRPQVDFCFPEYEAADGPGGLPFDLERFARLFEARFGPSLEWTEIVPAIRWLHSHMDRIEDYWERGPGRAISPPSQAPHNLGIYGWDLLDAITVDPALIDQRLAGRFRRNVVAQLVQNDCALAANLVLGRAGSGAAGGSALQTAEELGRAGTVEGDGDGIETLVVMLGSNNALRSVVHLHPRWTPEDYLDHDPLDRLEMKSEITVWRPEHFAAEWAEVVRMLERTRARHVIVATVPNVTIAPIARGVGEKVAAGSRYFAHYTRPWITDAQFDPDKDPHITAEEARALDSAIDAYNDVIVDSVRRARQAGRDWYVLELGGALDRLAVRRYIDDPSARPDWWTPYPLPKELTELDPVPSTRFYRSDESGRIDGGIFSLDGVHPTTSTYGLIAQEVITIMDRYAQVTFRGADGSQRTPGEVRVDMSRVLAADTLLTSPPASVSSTLSLLGWLDDAVDCVRGVFRPF